MTAYIIFEVEVHDAAVYAKNQDLIQPTLEPYGGRFLVRGGAVEALEGTWNPRRLVVIEFPSVERAKAWWKSDEYRGPKRIRQQTTTTQMIVVEGLSGT